MIWYVAVLHCALMDLWHDYMREADYLHRHDLMDDEHWEHAESILDKMDEVTKMLGGLMDHHPF